MTDHDPLLRREPEEPCLPILARDQRGPGMCSLYAALREKKFDQADVIYQRLKEKCATLPLLPKDAQHAWSARNVAVQMEDWYRHHILGKPPSTRVNMADPFETESIIERTDFDGIAVDDAGAFADAEKIAAIKRATPPPTPDEAS